jgi:hypothetical protein
MVTIIFEGAASLSAIAYSAIEMLSARVSSPHPDDTDWDRASSDVHEAREAKVGGINDNERVMS